MGPKERAIACFIGLATGDAIGKQTETLSRTDVRRWYPDGIKGFHGRPGEIIPRYVGNRNREWRIGETTDDTEQTIAVAKSILRLGAISHAAVGEELLRCRKSCHPGVSIWTFQQIGDPTRIALEGDGCGAAMRVAPVGMMYSSSRLDELVQGAYECAVPTHGGQLAICAAAAVAAAVSAAIDNRSASEVLKLAIEASVKAEAFRQRRNGTTIAGLTRAMHQDLSHQARLSADHLAEAYFPDRPETIVPLAINLALLTESAEETILLGANIGGDADSVASIGGAIAGALWPSTVSQAWFGVVRNVNDHPIPQIAESLIGLRH
jgi:ADP-ribosylglycohydrolase